MSPGLALFLFGVSSLPAENGDFGAPRVWVSMLAGVLLMATFVWHSFRPEHPLLDLRLFRNRNLTVSIVTMFLFAAAFFGGLLLVPTYFQQIRGESTLHAGLLVAPQGLGAMVTMPIAGRLVDKVPVGRIVPVGIALIVVGMFGLTQITSTTPYLLIIGMLVVMGFGMGATMMPLFTSALRTLSGAQVARGSTLLNISQQIASSCGVATMAVILTNQLNNSPIIPGTQRVPGLGDGLRETQAAILSNTRPENLAPLHIDPAAIARGLVDAATAFSHTYWVAWVLVVLTLVPALMLPRKHEETYLVDEGAPPAVVD
jgi:EmrB/QacA subfamily drug resistance transporter